MFEDDNEALEKYLAHLQEEAESARPGDEPGFNEEEDMLLSEPHPSFPWLTHKEVNQQAAENAKGPRSNFPIMWPSPDFIKLPRQVRDKLFYYDAEEKRWKIHDEFIESKLIKNWATTSMFAGFSNEQNEEQRTRVLHWVRSEQHGDRIKRVINTFRHLGFPGNRPTVEINEVVKGSLYPAGIVAGMINDALESSNDLYEPLYPVIQLSDQLIFRAPNSSRLCVNMFDPSKINGDYRYRLGREFMGDVPTKVQLADLELFKMLLRAMIGSMWEQYYDALLANIWLIDENGEYTPILDGDPGGGKTTLNNIVARVLSGGKDGHYSNNAGHLPHNQFWDRSYHELVYCVQETSVLTVQGRSQYREAGSEDFIPVERKKMPVAVISNAAFTQLASNAGFRIQIDIDNARREAVYRVDAKNGKKAIMDLAARGKLVGRSSPSAGFVTNLWHCMKWDVFARLENDPLWVEKWRERHRNSSFEERCDDDLLPAYKQLWESRQNQEAPITTQILRSRAFFKRLYTRWHDLEESEQEAYASEVLQSKNSLLIQPRAILNTLMRICGPGDSENLKKDHDKLRTAAIDDLNMTLKFKRGGGGDRMYGIPFAGGSAADALGKYIDYLAEKIDEMSTVEQEVRKDHDRTFDMQNAQESQD